MKLLLRVTIQLILFPPLLSHISITFVTINESTSICYCSFKSTLYADSFVLPNVLFLCHDTTFSCPACNLGFGEEIECHSLHIKKKETMTYLLLILTSTTGLRDYLSGFPLSIPYSLEGSRYANPTLAGWQVMIFFLDGGINK